MALHQYFLPLHRQAAAQATVQMDHNLGIPLGLATLAVRRVAAVVAVGVEAPLAWVRPHKATMGLAGPPLAVVAEAVQVRSAKNPVRVELALAIQLMVHQ